MTEFNAIDQCSPYPGASTRGNRKTEGDHAGCDLVSENSARTIDLIWDGTRERPTLGGALTLRMEGELLARHWGAEKLAVHLVGDPIEVTSRMKLAQAVFASSAHCVSIDRDRYNYDGWPPACDRARPEFSYFTFERVAQLSQEYSIRPVLEWNSQLETRIKTFRGRFGGQVVALHLKRVAPFILEESNADPGEWEKGIRRHVRPGVLEFVLVGDDEPPIGVLAINGVTRAADAGLDLAGQLCLIAMADGYLGMASGVSTVANFSDVPHVIFKHPEHHAAEMLRELGLEDRFSFAAVNQVLWRRHATAEAIGEALEAICR